MTIQDFGSIGELIAPIASVATLVYLAVQIRQNTRSVRTAAFQSGVDSINQLNNLLAHDESMARIFRVVLHPLNVGTLLKETNYADPGRLRISLRLPAADAYNTDVTGPFYARLRPHRSRPPHHQPVHPNHCLS